MSDLDERLRELLDELGEGFYPMHEYPPSYEPQNKEKIEEMLAQIKQAFAEEFRMIPKTKWSGGVFSGQEFYERFEAELHDVGVCLDTSRYKDVPNVKLLFGSSVIEAAKRAAGIEP
jgi:hypothetical protein